ncbi:MAG TPA: YceI family protein [Myxococcales bacterium]|jgi:polyisoprenoid-binding protein YceI
MTAVSTLAAAVAALALAQAPAPATAPTVFSVDAAGSTLSYGVVHKFHKVGAESREVEGRAALLPDGKVQVQVRAPVRSFKSGDSNRDAHMEEVLETSKYSYVTFKGLGQLTPPASFPAVTELALQGQLELHGRKRAENVPIKVEWTSPTQLRVKAAFNVSLDAYEIERPSLLFIKIEDACAIGVDVALKGEAAK